MSDAPTALRALQSAFGLYGAVYVSTAIGAPSWFLDTLSVNHLERRSAQRQRAMNMMTPKAPWYAMPAAFLTMFAVGVLVYAATYAVVSVVPYDWGSHDEDGEWESIRTTIQYGVGLIGGVGLCLRLEKNAEALVREPLERKARQATTKALRYARGVTPDLKDSVIAAIDKELETDHTLPHSFQRDYATDLHRWVRSDIRG